MTDLEDLQACYESAKRELCLGNQKEAKSIFCRIIDGCRSMLTVTESHRSENDSNAPASQLCLEHERNEVQLENINKLLALAYNNRGHIRYQEVDFDEAVEDYTTALCYDKTLSVAYYNRGLIHYRLGRFAAAVADQEEALRRQPDFPSAETCRQQAEAELHRASTS